MKVFVKGGTSCMNRKGDLYRYRKYITSCGHDVVDKEEDADTILVWCCAFREDYRESSYHLMNELQNNSNAEVILCGCLPAIDPDGVKQRFKGQYFSWKDQEKALPELFGLTLNGGLEKTDRRFVEVAIEDIENYKETHPESKVVFHDQFMKLFISEGCSLRCSYCSEIQSFPKYKSFPLGKLVSEARRVYELTGQNKILFCGDSIGDYGPDIGSTLIELIERILDINESIQVGFNNFNPLHLKNYLDQLLEFIRANKICFMDLPIQSASDRILSLMDRIYKVKDIEEIFSKINETGFKELETDVIIGFPSETDEDFEKTVDFLVRHKPKYVQISPYMDAAGARSCHFDGKIDKKIIEERMKIIKDELKRHNVLFDSAGSNIVKDWPDLPID